MTPTATPALAPEDRPEPKSLDEEEEPSDAEVDSVVAAPPVALGTAVAEAVEEESGRLKSEDVTLKQGTWMSKLVASTKVFSGEVRKAFVSGR